MQLLLSDLGALNLQGQPNFNLWVLLIWTWLLGFAEHAKVKGQLLLRTKCNPCREFGLTPMLTRVKAEETWSVEPLQDVSAKRRHTDGLLLGRDDDDAPRRALHLVCSETVDSGTAAGVIRTSFRRWSQTGSHLILKLANVFDFYRACLTVLLLLFQRKCLVYFSLNDHMKLTHPWMDWISSSEGTKCIWFNFNLTQSNSILFYSYNTFTTAVSSGCFIL